MKKLVILIGAFSLLSFTNEAGTAYLQKIPAYQSESYFKNQVYQEKDLKAFYAMEEANKQFDPNNYDMHLLNAAFFYATNKLREEKKLPQFKYHEGLRDAAVIHTNEMVVKNFFDHFNKRDRKFYSPDDRIKMFVTNLKATAENCNEDFMGPAENLSYIQVAERNVKSLYNSPPHKANMLNKAYVYLGCAAIFEPKMRKTGAYYVKATQDFATLLK